MKRNTKKLMLVLFGTICALMLVLAGACGGGKRATLSLDAGAGGTLSETEISVKVGAPLGEILRAHTPEEKEGLTFAGWFNGNVQIASDATMPENGLSLRAKYDATYTVKLYISDDYGVYGEPTVTTGKARYGEPFSPQLPSPPAHFILDPEKESDLYTAALGIGDVFEIWYCREHIQIIYRSNAPDGVTLGGAVPSVPVLFGSSHTVAECTFTAPENYRFLYWTRTGDGTGERYFAGDKIENITETLSLFANWQRGYTDLFGGEDVIFPDPDGGDTLTLVRGGNLFTGTLSEDGSFSFGIGEDALEGKLGENYTFSYFRTEQRGEYLLFDAHLGASAGADAGVKLTLDGLGGAHFAFLGSAGEETVLSGSYLPIGKSDFTLELENGQTQTFILGTWEGVPVFSFYDGAAGTYAEALGHALAGVSPGTCTLTLDGLGGAELFDTDTYETAVGAYAVEEGYAEDGIFVIHTLIGESEMHIMVLSDLSAPLYLVREAHAGQYTAKDGTQATLDLDGYGLFGDSACLTEGEKTVYGPYWARESVRYGTVVDFYETAGEDISVRASYVLYGDKTFALLEAEAKEYTRIVLSSAGSASAQYPLILLDTVPYGAGAPAGALKAELYGLNASGASERIASGYYTVEMFGKIAYYTFVRTAAEGVDAAEVWESARFLTGSVSLEDGGSLDVYYTFYIDEKPLFTHVRAAEGEGELWISSVGVSGMGGLYFASDGAVYEGSYTLVNVVGGAAGTQYFTFTTYSEGTGADLGTLSREFYFEVKEEGGAYTFTLLDTLPDETASIFYRIDKYGMQADVDGDLLLFGANGTASYIQGADMYFYEGVYAFSGRTTAWGDKIYTFTPEEGEGGGFEIPPLAPFDFIFSVEGGAGYGYFRIFDETLCGTLTSGNGATLELDGFYFRAKYTDSLRITHEGEYLMYDDTTLWFRDGETGDLLRFPLLGDTFVDVDEEKTVTFAERYAVTDGSGLYLNGFEGYYLTFAQGGAAGLLNGSATQIASGTWTVHEEGIYETEFVLRSGERVAWRVKLTEEDVARAVVYDASSAGDYIGEDLSVLRLDGWGGGAYFDRYGTVFTVRTVRVSETYLVVAEAGGAWEFFVTVDRTQKKFLRAGGNAQTAVFYSEDMLHSLIFAGALYADGTLAGYYLPDEDGTQATLFTRGTGVFEQRTIALPASDTASYDYGGRTLYRYFGGEIEFAAKIVFEGREEVSSTLTLTPYEGETVFFAEASISYMGGGDLVKAGGFTVTLEGGKLWLIDTLGASYELELLWTQGGAGACTANLKGEFIYYNALLDVTENSYNCFYFGYFGVGEFKIGEDVWYFDFADAKDTAGTALRCISDTAPWEQGIVEADNQAHGVLYGIEMYGQDGELYYAMYFLVNADYSAWKQASSATPYALIYSIDLCITLETAESDGTEYTLEIEQCIFNNAFKNQFSEGDVLGAVLLRNGTAIDAAPETAGGQTLLFSAEEGTYAVTLLFGEDGFAEGFHVVFTPAP